MSGHHTRQGSEWEGIRAWLWMGDAAYDHRKPAQVNRPYVGPRTSRIANRLSGSNARLERGYNRHNLHPEWRTPAPRFLARLGKCQHQHEPKSGFPNPPSQLRQSCLSVFASFPRRDDHCRIWVGNVGRSGTGDGGHVCSYESSFPEPVLQTTGDVVTKLA